jgi:hypothetical protein
VLSYVVMPMDLENLLNPIGESQNMQETSDDDIFGAVMKCRNAREDVSGGDDVDGASPCKPLPSRCEVMQMFRISTIQLHSTWITRTSYPF